MSFERNLVILRKKKFPTQQALAEKMGVKRQAVNKWETGQTFLNKEDLYRLAEVLGVHVSVLFFDTVDENLTSVSEDSTRLKELSLRFHNERDKVEALESKVLRLEAELVKAKAAAEDHRKREVELDKQVKELSKSAAFKVKPKR